tara:strand:+ start:990 stop:1955 length:966 start_codon:yes stop_codon:yes gene_type:complete
MNYFDESTSIDVITDYIKKNTSILIENEIVKKIDSAGEGNMNVVLRIKTNFKSFILKQSRSHVKRFPQIKAPLERIYIEYCFYSLVKKNFFSPNVLGFINEDYVLFLEDLIKCRDLNYIYDSRQIDNDKVNKLALILHNIHITKAHKNYPANLALRKLNYDHIFVLPFLKDNGLQLNNIQDGLEELAIPFKENMDIIRRVNNAGKNYLDRGTTLLHGDYYPGSWMERNENIYIIDPEFTFLGLKEFDLGVMSGHLILATGQISYLKKICDNYPDKIDNNEVAIYCAIEIIRRLIGYAQLPIKRSIREKSDLLKLAKELIIN